MYVIERVTALRLQFTVHNRHCAAKALSQVCVQIEPVTGNVLLLDALMRIGTLLYVQLVRTGYRPYGNTLLVYCTGNIAVVLLYLVALRIVLVPL